VIDATNFPGRRNRHAIRARVINLDYNGPLVVSQTAQGLSHPQLTLIQKIAQLHANPQPIVDWTLLLTMNGQINWTDEVFDNVRDYLLENIKLSSDFASECELKFSSGLYQDIVGERSVDFAGLPRPLQQAVVSVLVPKKIASLVHGLGWHTRTFANYRYGGVEGRARMCTWAIRFRWDARSSFEPTRVYRESLSTIFEAYADIDADGVLVEM
jgi:hypothetical protein